MEFVIISDSKMISPRFSHSLSGLRFIFNHFFSSSSLLKCDRGLVRSLIRKSFRIPSFFNLQSFINIRTRQFFSQCLDCTFKSTINLSHDILGSLDKPTIPGNWMFHLSNPHTEAILDYVASIKSGQQFDTIVYLFS
jgi:hypothetical protein